MADNNKNLTVYQKLFYLFGQGGGPKASNIHNKYNLTDNDLIITKSKQDFEREKLQLQQQKYLGSQWTKVDNELYQKSVFYETSRIASYMDYEAMEFCLAGDTKIATPNGFITIKELADKGRDNEFITYAYDHNLKQVVPAKARNAHYTRDEMTYKIVFDDDSYIIATWEHRLMKRDGSFCKVNELKEGDSMMPFYRKSFFNNKNHNWIYTCNDNLGSSKNGWVPEHDLITESFYSNEEVQDIDFNGKNNSPHFHIPWDLIVDTATEIKTLKSTAKTLGISHTKLRREITINGYKDWLTFLEAYSIKPRKYTNTRATGEKLKINHKIKSIEPHKVIPVYDLTVPGYKNFATDTIFSHNTPEIAVALDIMSEESCLVGSTLIPLLNGENVPIKDLFDKNYANFWVYGIKLSENEIKPSVVEKVVYKGYKDVYKVTLDDDTEVICTPDHKWLGVDNKWVDTIKLELGTPLKSVYRKETKKGYEKISLNDHWSDYKLTHRVVADDVGYSITKMKGFIKNSNKPHKEFGLYCSQYGLDYNTTRRFINKKGYNNWLDLVNNVDNHRVIKIEYVGKEDVYDLVNSSVDSSFAVKCQSGMIISHNCTLNEQGKMLSIYSDSSRVKKVLEDLFFNVLDIHSNLPMWTRNVCKYGDNFLYLKIDYKDGIVGGTQLTNIDIERREGDNLSFQQDREQLSQEVKKKQVVFIWKNKSLEFNPWEIAHFRLLGDDRKLPYGTSVLEKVRRIWKQLLLAEDAMLVYRVTRAPERRVFKVYVGNIDDNDVEAYVQKVANKFKRTQTTDNQTGQTDIRYNTLAVDQDYFVPVRDPNAASPIETLPGATNLDQIADIQFIQRKMVTALRVPKTFLGFEEPTGEGKNLALLDIRFARTINRIQQSIIQELNKIAIIHLYILGFHDELNDFKLSLNNPSTQGEMLKVEQWKEKVLLYKDLVGSVDGGIAPTSHTWAKKNIFNWSSDEILEDLEQQRLEKAVAAELEQTPEIIKKTGFFKKVDKLYGELPMDQGPIVDEGGATEGIGGETGFGIGDDGGGFGDFGGGDDGGGGFGDFGGGDDGGTGGFGEGFRGDGDVIDRLLVEGRKKNEDIFMMTKGIDGLLNKKNGGDGGTLND